MQEESFQVNTSVSAHGPDTVTRIHAQSGTAEVGWRVPGCKCAATGKLRQLTFGSGHTRARRTSRTTCPWWRPTPPGSSAQRCRRSGPAHGWSRAPQQRPRPTAAARPAQRSLSAWLMDANTAALSAQLPCHLVCVTPKRCRAHDCIPFSLTCIKRFAEPADFDGTCTDTLRLTFSTDCHRTGTASYIH